MMLLAPLTSSMPSILPGLLLLFLSLPQPIAGQAPATFTLPWEPEYNLLGSCGKNCLYGAADVWIGGKLGCTSGPYTNDCMCRLDKAPAISSYASECNKNWCTAGGDSQQDINTFLSLYNSYCAKNGYTLPGAAAIAEPTSGGSPTIIGESTAATVTRVTHATVTAPSSDGSKSGMTTSLSKWGGALAVVVSAWVASS